VTVFTLDDAPIVLSIVGHVGVVFVIDGLDSPLKVPLELGGNP